MKRPFGLLAGLLCAAVTLSALAGIAASLLAIKPLWFMLGFEVITVVAGVIGVMTAMGRFGTGPAMALLCVAATVAVGSLLTHLSAELVNPMAGPVLRRIGERPITLFLVLREVGAVGIGLCAAWVVLSRRPRESLSSLLKGAAFGVALVLVVGATWTLRGRAAGLGSLVQAVGGLIVAFLALCLLAGAVHFVVRAFEAGRVGDGGVGPRGSVNGM